MKKEQTSPTFSPKTQIILMSLIVGCVIAVSSNYHKTALKEAAEKNSSAYPYALSDIEKVLDDQLQGWNNGNVDQFMEGYVKDSTVRFITSKKVKTSWQEITDSYKKGYPNKEAMGKLSFNRDEIRWINQQAGISQVIGRWEVIQTRKSDQSVTGSMGANKPIPSDRTEKIITDTLSGRFSLIFVGTQQGPRIQVDHTW